MIAHGCLRRAQSQWWDRRPQCEVRLRYPAPLAFRAQGLANAESWQDLHVVHDSRGLRSEKGPSWQDIHVVYPPTALCRTFRIHGAHILPKPAHFEYTAAIYCHEEAFFPSEAFFGVHRGKILPSSDTWERITSTYRHRQAPGNAFRGRGAMPSAAGDTGFRANCAARAPMNPFTPTFSRCGTDIEFICYATNK